MGFLTMYGAEGFRNSERFLTMSGLDGLGNLEYVKLQGLLDHSG